MNKDLEKLIAQLKKAAILTNFDEAVDHTLIQHAARTNGREEFTEDEATEIKYLMMSGIVFDLCDFMDIDAEFYIGHFGSKHIEAAIQAILKHRKGGSVDEY